MLDDNNILYKYQSGFRKYYSTDTCLLYLDNKVQIGFEQGLMTGVILIDLQNAFDTIDHDILLEKTHCLGFSEPTIQCFRSYLTNRLFSVNVGNEFHPQVNYLVESLRVQSWALLFLLYVNVVNEFSSSGKLSCGVPQG